MKKMYMLVLFLDEGKQDSDPVFKIQIFGIWIWIWLKMDRIRNPGRYRHWINVPHRYLLLMSQFEPDMYGTLRYPIRKLTKAYKIPRAEQVK